MALNRYSKQLKKYTGELNPEIQCAIQDIKVLLNKRKLDILEWDANSVAINIVLNIEIPPRGCYQNIDIRKKEPVLIVFNKASYPYKAPRAYSDRLDFPKNNLAHLYVSRDGKPAPFCLTRGNINEWFAEKEIRDYVFQIKSWLSDAASGELATDSNQYEPLRLEGYSGTCVYKYKEFADYVNSKQGTISNKGFILGLFYETQAQTEKNAASFRFLGFVETQDDVEKVFKNNLGLTGEKHIDKWQYGIILWDKNHTIQEEYLVELPSCYEELYQFCKNLNMDISAAIEIYCGYAISTKRSHFPVIVSIKRPYNIIGYNSDIEFVNFVVTVSLDEINTRQLNADSRVVFQSHIEPLSIAKSREVSGFKNNLGSLIIAGCGALGSKIVMHLMRSGHTNMLLLDGDSFSAHNLVRHSLFPEQVGKNKAMALKNVAELFYKYDNVEDDLIALPIDADILTNPKILDEAKWFLDFTASKSFFNHQIKNITKTSANICKATMLNNGKLGVLFIEGEKRNPRIDDLLVLTYDLYRQYPFIAQYLQDEYERSKQDSTIVNVGVGCNSETTILADEVVSMHSAAFCSVIKNEYDRKSFNENGFIFINNIDTNNGFKIESFSFVIKPLITATLPNGWEIRMKPEIAIKMKSEMGIAMPRETGGIFIGIINKKNRTIHITDLILAPSDSKSNEVTFYRGINGLPEEIDKIKNLSGQTFGYIGEWHSHPFGPNGLSQQDMKEINIHLKELRELPNPMPLFIMLVTPDGLIPFVFE
jgi:hypothetical protein